MSVKTTLSSFIIASSLIVFSSNPALAKTPTQIKNEQRAKDYKAKKAAEKTARKTEQANRKRH